VRRLNKREGVKKEGSPTQYNSQEAGRFFSPEESCKRLDRDVAGAASLQGGGSRRRGYIQMGEKGGCSYGREETTATKGNVLSARGGKRKKRLVGQ